MKSLPRFGAAVLTAAAMAASAAVIVPSLATGQSAPTRASATSLSLTTTPARDRTRPYTFTSRGKLTLPTTFCAPGAGATPTSNCIPINCPPGATDATYCVRPTQAQLCAGVVNIRYQRNTTTISSRNVNLRSDCTYTSQVTFRSTLRTRQGVLNVRARFQGNSSIVPRSSATRTVRAG